VILDGADRSNVRREGGRRRLLGEAELTGNSAALHRRAGKNCDRSNIKNRLFLVN
jgi:hypothetical protein